MSKFSFSPPPTPTNLVANEGIVVINNRAVNQVQLSWDVDIGVNNYRLAYFFNSDIKGSPYPQVIGTGYTLVDVTGNSYSINGIGRGYLNIFIYGIIKGGIASNTPLRAQIHTLGKVAPPENVSGFKVQSRGTDFVKASWTKATEADVLNGGQVEIRYASVTSGATWEGSVLMAKVAASNDEVILSTEASGSFLAKFIDDGGRKSATEAISVFTQPVFDYERKRIGIWRENTYAYDWVGLTANFIDAETSSNVSLVNASDKSEGIKLTDATTKTGTYSFALGHYLGSVQGYTTPFTFSVERHIKMTTFYSTDAFASRGNVQDMQSFSGAKAPDVNVRFFYKTTTSTVENRQNATWSDWTEFTSTDIRGTGFTFKAVIETTDPTQNVKITELGVNWTMPFRFMSPNTAAVYPADAASVDVTYTVPFWASNTSDDPNVQITPLNFATGEYYTITLVTGTGFRLAMKKANGDPVDAIRTFNFSVSGYGYAA